MPFPVAAIRNRSSAPPASSTPTALVSGAGTVVANGSYPFFSMINGKPAYQFNGSGDPDTEGISWNLVSWNINYPDGSYYTSSEDVAFPWLVLTWTPSDGDPPSPTVTESP